MESYRLGTFETNSSSCDALIYLDNQQFNLLKVNQLVITTDDNPMSLSDFIQRIYDIINEDVSYYDEETDTVLTKEEAELISKDRLVEIFNKFIEDYGCFDDHMSQMSFNRTFTNLKEGESELLQRALDYDPFCDGFAIGLKGLKYWGKLCWHMDIDERGKNGVHEINFSTFG